MNKNTAKRNAMKATTRGEQELAKIIAAMPPGSDERAELEDEISNPWIFDLIEALESQQQEDTTP